MATVGINGGRRVTNGHVSFATARDEDGLDDIDAATDKMLFRDSQTWSKGKLRRAKFTSFITGNRQPSRQKVFSEIHVTKDFREWTVEVQGVSIRHAKIYNPALLLKQRVDDSKDEQEQADFQRFLGHLPNIQRLELEDPEGTLTSVPKQLIGQMTRLESLSMTWTKIRTLPAALFQLPLNSLYLQRNQIRSLDGVERAESLTILDISNNKLESLPRTFGQLANLVTLNLSGNCLRELPESIGNLMRLKSLDVSSNKLRVIPESIRTVIELTSLDVSSNQLTALPEALSGLPNIEDMRARSNQLRTLPVEFGQLRRLNSLLLRNNKFDEVPSQLASLPSLTNLNMRENLIKRMDKPVRSLNYLVLDNNELEAIGSGITGCVNLQLLSLKHNRLTAIAPEVFKLVKLKSLHLSENKIAVIPTQLCCLAQLRHLSVSSTDIQTIPLDVAAMPTLSTLEMDDCSELDGYLKMEYKKKGLPGVVEHLRNEQKEDEEESSGSAYASIVKPGNSKPLVDLTKHKTLMDGDAVAMRPDRTASNKIRNQAGISIVPGMTVRPPDNEAVRSPGAGGGVTHIARQSIFPTAMGSGRGRENPLASADIELDDVSAPAQPVIKMLPEFGDLTSSSQTDGSVRGTKKLPVQLAGGYDDIDEEDDDGESAQFVYAQVNKKR